MMKRTLTIKNMLKNNDTKSGHLSLNERDKLNK